MNENYIVINGKKIELTEEQLKQLGIEPEKKRKNPFERVEKDDKYSYIHVNGDVLNHIEVHDNADRELYNVINYFNDEQFAKQVSLHQLLYRKLLKFAWDNEAEDTLEWDAKNVHYGISYDCHNHKFILEVAIIYKNNGVYFSSKEAVERAIKEVVEPFMKEHPEFVW